MNIVTTGSSCSGGGCAYPIVVNGTCTSSGCPNVRLDNLTTPNGNMCNVSDGSFIAASNVFGVVDHNTIGTVPPACNAPVLVNVGHGSWQGVGSWGDNSWASTDTFGTNQQLYVENNHIISGLLTDTDIGGSNGGGARQTCRFNTIDNINSGGGCTGHGTDTTGRARGVRQWEAYWNTGVCANTTIGCGSFVPGRSGVGRAFANSFSNNPSTAFFKGMADLGAQRRWRPDAPWGPCDGATLWDTNEGTVYYSGTIASISGAGNPWTVLNSSSSGWATNQWVSPGAPYSIHDVTAYGGFEIGSSTSNSITANSSVAGSAGAYNPARGDNYQILKALVCMDQPARGAGLLVQNNANGNPVLISTGNPGPVNQTLDPTYEADDAEGSHADHTIQSQTGGLIANRDWYAESVNQAAQTSPASPFNGSSGTGHGSLANRPTTCNRGVGYWATDQGTWNTFDSTKEGVLYICTGTNTWTLSYTPYTYPHPLIAGGGTGRGSNSPAPPTGLAAIVQ